MTVSDRGRVHEKIVRGIPKPQPAIPCGEQGLLIPVLFLSPTHLAKIMPDLLITGEALPGKHLVSAMTETGLVGIGSPGIRRMSGAVGLLSKELPCDPVGSDHHGS